MESRDHIKPWGMALERLREDRGLSATELCYRVRMGLPEYRVICYKLKKGPSVETLGRLIEALDCTWAEWGQVYDAVKAGISSAHEAVLVRPAVNDRHGRSPGVAHSKAPASRGMPPSRIGKLARP